MTPEQLAYYNTYGILTFTGPDAVSYWYIDRVGGALFGPLIGSAFADAVFGTEVARWVGYV